MKSRDLVLRVSAAALLLSLACPLQAGLIGYYSFDAANGADGSGTGNHATVGGSIQFLADVPFGMGQSARNFTGGGGGNVMTVPTSSSLQGIKDELTVSFWMKSNLADNANWVRIFQHGSEANGTQTWLIDRNSSNNYTNMRVDTIGTGGQFNQNIANGGPNTFNGQWHHLVYTVDSGAWQKFIDSSRLSGTYNHGTGFGTTRALYMFGRNGGGEYVGLMDDIAIWDEALNTGEAKALYNLAKHPALAYGAGDANRLFDLYAAGEGTAFIGEDVWTPATGLGGSAGDVVTVGGSLALVLDGNGGGVLNTVPEPATLGLAFLACSALGGYVRRRRR